METTPKSLRLQVGLFGRTNVGKSSVMNLIAGQDVALISPIPGTTTDVVDKPIELLPLGPVSLLDTAGFDDVSELAEGRIYRTRRILDRAEIILLIVEPNTWTDYEEQIISEIKDRKIPYVIIVNKTDLKQPDEKFKKLLKTKADYIIYLSAIQIDKRDEYLTKIKDALIALAPDNYIKPLPLLGDLIPKGGLVVMIMPIDKEAPKGRLILPQVQALRDVLDNDSISIVTKETEYPAVLPLLKRKPDLVVCDSQVVDLMMAETPEDIKTTTFSILFARYKGDLIEEVKGAAAVKHLRDGDKVLIAEACSHHANEDDIGRVKIPRWLRQFTKAEIQIEHAQGRDFPDNLKEYAVVVHCGGCMLTRNEKLVRIDKCKRAGVPITNYGLTISLTQGVLERALSPFPEALDAFRNWKRKD
jgi:[FeFe] hydrogenase H-cluster maturation GTPase HydF